MAQLVIWSDIKQITEAKDINFRTAKKMIENEEIDSVWRKIKRKGRGKDEIIDKMIFCGYTDTPTHKEVL